MKKEDEDNIIMNIIRKLQFLNYSRKGSKSYDLGNFEEAVKKFSEAAQLNPDNADTFNKWGNALYDLAKIEQNEQLFREAIEKYAEVARLDPDNADALNNWGNALSELGIIKQEEKLFKESFEKYAKATDLKQDDASVFNNWGTALSDLANIKQDKELFKKSFEKYDKAIKINPNYAAVFYNWGAALYDLAQIEQNESLFQESCENYDKACEKYNKANDLKPDDADVFYNWGAALYDSAKIKKDKSLFYESFEKYDKATKLKTDDADAFCNWGAALYDLAKIEKNKSLFKESIECFKKSRLDILDILVSFHDMMDRKHIVQIELLNPLLDSDTDDGRFFQETTKNVKDKMELDKYKNVYIRSMLIISQLYVNGENDKKEKGVAYYCEKTIAQKMLFRKTKFHLNAINYSNDPTEGRTLLDYLFGKEKSPKKEALNTEYGAFAGSFTFNHDSLNQFRLYGKEDGREGTGLSLVFRNSFFSKEAKTAMKQREDSKEDSITDEKEEKHALFRCMYIDPETRRVETVGHKEAYLFYRKKNEEETAIEKKIEDYRKYIDNIVENVRMEMENLKALVQDLEQPIIEQLLINLRYLTKHIAFKEEQECRIVKIYNINDSEIKVSDNFKQMYVRYKPHVVNHIEKVYFGPKAEGMELFHDIVTRNRMNSIIHFDKSKNHLT